MRTTDYNGGYRPELDHNMDGRVDGLDVDTYIDNIALGGPKSAKDLLALQAAGCEIDAEDLKAFAKEGGELSGKDVVSFVANGGKLTAEDYNALRESGVTFSSKETDIMESAMKTDLNGDGNVPGPELAQTHLAEYGNVPRECGTPDPFLLEDPGNNHLLYTSPLLFEGGDSITTPFI